MPKAAPEKPTESPFEETEAETGLRRIAEAARHRKQTYAAFRAADAKSKAAKKVYEDALEEEQQIIDEHTIDLPLFPRERSKVAEPNGKPAPTGTIFLSTIDGIPSAALVHLGAAGIQTVEDYNAWLDGGSQLTEIDGITESLAGRIQRAVARHLGL
jgi:hypothetical protein